jgi:hypothetical protein
LPSELHISNGVSVPTRAESGLKVAGISSVWQGISSVSYLTSLGSYSCLALYLPPSSAVLPHWSVLIMAPTFALVAGLAAISAVNAMPFTIPYLDKTGRVEVQGHRGGLGMRSEESLWVRTNTFRSL